MKYLISAVLVTIFTSYDAHAANSYNVGNNSTVKINEHGICKQVRNFSGKSVMVPTRTIAEWGSFISNTPINVLALECPVDTITGLPTCSAGQVLTSDGSKLYCISVGPYFYNAGKSTNCGTDVGAWRDGSRGGVYGYIRFTNDGFPQIRVRQSFGGGYDSGYQTATSVEISGDRGHRFRASVNGSQLVVERVSPNARTVCRRNF